MSHGSTKKYQAKVICYGYQCDLALLELKDQKFFEGKEALSFGNLPNLQG